MLDKFKPMLACECTDLSQVRFPIGMLYGIPRLPIFLGFRDEIDMGE